MAKKILGNLQVGRYASSQGRNLTRSVEGANFSTSGSLEIDSYTQDEFNKIISVLPLSHYGSFSFLPAGVYGSFEGASDVPAYRYRKIQVEDDGTLLILRSGTNGAKRALYYSYMNNILSTTDLNTSINSNREYKPGYFGSTYTAKMAYASDAKIVSGLAFDSSNAQYIFISWTNGTLNDTQHVGSIVPIATLMPNGGTVRFVMTGNTNIYFFVENSASTNLILEMRSIPISQVLASATTLTVTEYQNWTNTTFYGRTVSNSNIVLNERKTDTTAATFPYAVVPASTTGTEPYMTGVDLYAAQTSTGIIRLRVVGDMWCTTASRSIRPKHSYSILLNPTTKVSTLEDFSGSGTPITITDPGSGSSLVATGQTISVDPITTNNGNRGNLVMGYYYFDNGTTIAIGTENLGTSPTKIQRAVYPSATSVYDTLRVRQHSNSADWVSGSMKTAFGSTVGSEVMGFEWLPNSHYKVCSYDGNSVFRNSVNQYVPGPTYSFGSVSLGTINGFQPTTNRVFAGTTPNERIFISTISGSTVTTNGGVLIENYKTTTPLSYDQNMVGTGTISINSSLLTSFKTQRLNAATLPIDQTNKTNITVYIPQQTDCPAFALISGVTPTLTNYLQIVEVNVNARSGTISTLTFKRLVHESVGSAYGGIAADATYGVQGSSVGITIYDAGTFYMIGGVDPYVYKTQGDTNSTTWRAKVTKSTQQMDDFVVSGTYQAHTSSSGQLPWAVPGVGFGYIDFSRNADDDRVRVIFQPVGTTLAQYNAWADNGSPILLASQDVAQGFILYFTEPTPVLLSGKSFTMPIQNIDLTTVKANPANTTFNIYVIMQEGLAKYIASETVIAETGTSAYNTFWIGTVTTNNLQIDTITIYKRSRLDVFGTSLEAAGSSIPVSYGLPTGSGTINW